MDDLGREYICEKDIKSKGCGSEGKISKRTKKIKIISDPTFQQKTSLY